MLQMHIIHGWNSRMARAMGEKKYFQLVRHISLVSKISGTAGHLAWYTVFEFAKLVGTLLLFRVELNMLIAVLQVIYSDWNSSECVNIRTSVCCERKKLFDIVRLSFLPLTENSFPSDVWKQPSQLIPTDHDWFQPLLLNHTAIAPFQTNSYHVPNRPARA